MLTTSPPTTTTTTNRIVLCCPQPLLESAFQRMDKFCLDHSITGNLDTVSGKITGKHNSQDVAELDDSMKNLQFKSSSNGEVSN